jgi:flagellar basal-body rod protein FlgG
LDGIGGGEAYTRAGNLLIDVEGNLVLGTTDGPIVEFGGSFPEGTDKNSITVTSDGRITAMVDGEEQEIGELMLYRFPNPHGLRQMGGNLLVESESSGAPTEGNPGENGYGTLVQRFLEASNVDPVRELVSMIRTQRSFELNSKTIQAADENLQVVSRLRR